MLSQEAVVAEEFATLVIIFLVHKSRVALGTAEALVVPVLLSFKQQVLHMDWHITSSAVLRHRLCLNILAPASSESDKG